MTHRRIVLMALIALGQLCAPVSHATELPQSEDSKSMEQMQHEVAAMTVRLYVQPVVDVLKQQTAGDNRVQELLSRLTFDINPWALNAGNAYSYPESRSAGAGVVVDMGLLMSLFSLSELGHMPLDSYKQQVQEWYTTYVEDTRMAIKQGSAAPWMNLPLKEFVPDPVQRAFIEAMSKQEDETAIAWVVLHEVAHHVLGHVGKKPDNLEQSRQWELDADAWAFRKLRDLHYPLNGVDAFLHEEAVLQARLVGLCDGQNTPASPDRLKEVERQSTHPLWQTRAATLDAKFDVEAQPEVAFILFTAMGVYTQPDGQTKMVKMTVGFPAPQNAAVWGMGTVIDNDGSGNAVWVEYNDGHAYIFGARAGIFLNVETPGKLVSRIEWMFKDENGAVKTISLFGWYDALAASFTSEVKGMTLLDLANLYNPAHLYNSIFLQMPWDESTKSTMIDTSNGCIKKMNAMFLQYHKGLISLTDEQRQDVMSKGFVECQAALKNKIGEERMKAFSAKLLENEAVQAAIVHTMKGQKLQ